MARGRKLESLNAYRNALSKGYGKGEGSAYLPWLTVYDLSTRGTSAIVQGYKTKRDHHCLSQQEKYCFLLAEFSDQVVDIREQFPLLPLDLACQLAQTLRIKYPEIPGTKVPNVQSTDFLLTLQKPGYVDRSYLAVSVKPADELKRPRVLEKLELERVWWQLLGVPFKLFVCTDLQRWRALDIEWLTESIRSDGSYDHAVMDAACSSIDGGIYPIAELVELVKTELSASAEEALKILKCLIVHRYLSIDWSTPILSSRLITVLGKVPRMTRYGVEHK